MKVQTALVIFLRVKWFFKVKTKLENHLAFKLPIMFCSMFQINVEPIDFEDLKTLAGKSPLSSLEPPLVIFAVSITVRSTGWFY